MNKGYFNENIQWLTYQRNVFLALSLILSTGIVIMSCFLFFKTERTIIVPPVIEKEFWVEANKVSPTYLEQQGQFLSQLLFGKSSKSSKTQRDILLRHVSSSFYTPLKNKLMEEEAILQKENVSYSFFPTQMEVNASKLEVLVVGDKVAYLGGQNTLVKKESYVLGFVFSGGRVLLNSLTLQGV
jgi:conjugal transfer pilus assembly protein TraE